MSGVFEGKTLGTPIAILVREQTRIAEVSRRELIHIALLMQMQLMMLKYGIRNWQGGGKSSARETIGRVELGAIAKKISPSSC